MSKEKIDAKNINDWIPWWTYGIAILFGIFFGALGVVIIFAFLYGYWFLWKKSEFKTSKKILISFLPIIVIGAIYLIFIGYSGYDYYQDINENMETQNVEVETTSIEDVKIENSEFNFELTYPSDWFKDSIFRENIVLQLKPEDELSSLTIKKYDTEWTSHDEYLEYTTKEDLIQNFEQTEQIELISVDDITIDNIPTFQINYYENSPTISGTQKFKVMSIYLIRPNNQMLGINYVALPEDFDSKSSEAFDIIDSINFK